MKNIVCGALLFGISCSLINRAMAEQQHPEPVKLPIPSFADGKVITGEGVNFMMMLRRDVRRMQLGTSEQGKIKGCFVYKNQHYTLKELIALESTAGNDRAFKACLKAGKDEFMAKMAPWIGYGKGVKKVLTLLITEFCKRSNKPNSYLQQWGILGEGEEEKFFENEINSAHKFDLFLTDMVGLFEALISSCPKAVEQFTHEMRMKALRKSAETIILEESTSNEYLTHPHIQETIIEQLIHHVERDLITNGSISHTVQPDKLELKKFLELIIQQDKEKMETIRKIVMPMIAKKVAEAAAQEEFIWEVRKTLDNSSEPIEKEVIKRIVARLLKEEGGSAQK
jgi:hypothetical protein